MRRAVGKAPPYRGGGRQAGEVAVQYIFQGGSMKTLPYSKENISFTRSLRKNMTKEERHLWYDFLRTYPVKFYKQRRIGNYIADFYCKEAGLIIELDGGQHYDEAGMESDQERTTVLESYGLTVIRFTNLDIHKNFRGVCQTIHQYVNEHKGCSW